MDNKNIVKSIINILAQESLTVLAAEDILNEVRHEINKSASELFRIERNKPVNPIKKELASGN